MNLTSVQTYLQPYLEKLMGWLASPQFYAQVGAILAAVLIGRLVAGLLLKSLWLLNAEPQDGKLIKYRTLLYSCRDLLRPALIVLALAVSASLCDVAIGTSWLARFGQRVALILLLHSLINRFLANPLLNASARWVGLPVAAVVVFGYFDDATAWLDSVALEAGNIRISLLALGKAAFFGGILFWLGRVSSDAGQRAIRQQETVDIQTRELAAKALQLAIFAIVALLLLNVLGLDLTALAVFSGALGVGLGFGLQQIASNFISGIIILIERSLKVGDLIELEDGRSGILKDINMRSSRLATSDGKDIMVPNERFITTRFVNWTQSDPRQRYDVNFTVNGASEIPKVKSLIERAVADCAGVLLEPEPPTCEIEKFNEYGVQFAARFWLTSSDGNESQVCSAAHLAIWQGLKKARIDMVFGKN
jgi:small-conductance mechanosensitive channel